MHAADIVKALDLQPHPEGGYFRETYRASEAIPIAGLDRRYGGARATSTAIYYLLEAGQRSALHRLKSDEIFHFYTGDALTIIEIAPDGRFTETLLGADFAAGAVPQHVIPAGAWFGAVPTGRFSSRGFSPRGFSLVGCTVAPGFDFADFELAERAVLLAAFPRHETWIRRLT
jgi:predicted cupin superfamily sugar epimerase